ncbi:MAG: hypothetical protein QOJ26_1486 [Thermoplasmata archaeon]|nr:hypothetical protein [Thermoplasmata archaeon]
MRAGFAVLVVGVALALASTPAAAQPVEQLVTVTPTEHYEFRIAGQGKAVHVSILLRDGVSHGGTLSGDGTCGKAGASTNVIGLSTSGQHLASLDCGVLAKGRTLMIRFDSGTSAFVGSLRLVNATFAA